MTTSEFLKRSPAYIVTFLANGPITSISAGFAADLGTTEEALLNKKKLEDILTPGSRIFFQTHFFPLVKLHGFYNEVFLSFSSNGGELPVLFNASIAEDGTVICAGIRISKRNRYEQEILEAKRRAEKAMSENAELVKLKDELHKHQEELEFRLRKLTQNSREQYEINSVLSHDLQEPLRKLSTFGKMLVTDLVSAGMKRSEAHLNKILHSADYMRQLLQSIRQYLALNEKRFSPLSCDLKMIVHDAASNVFSSRNDVSLKISQAIPSNFSGDYAMLLDLFSEIFLNALNFRDSQKERLTVQVHADVVEENVFTHLNAKYQYSEFIRIQIEDNGIGFPESMAQEVLGLFKKAHVMHEGHGVGLANCRKIVELHHGKISLKSETGKGTRVTVLLPLRDHPHLQAS